MLKLTFMLHCIIFNTFAPEHFLSDEKKIYHFVFEKHKILYMMFYMRMLIRKLVIQKFIFNSAQKFANLP